jgi:hypothetical protein
MDSYQFFVTSGQPESISMYFKKTLLTWTRVLILLLGNLVLISNSRMIFRALRGRLMRGDP